MWKIPADVEAALKLYLGEVKPNKASRNADRMYINEFDAETQKKIVDFFTANKTEIVSDLFKGDGLYSAGWLMVALKSETKPRWVLTKHRLRNQILQRRPGRNNAAGKPKDRPHHNAAKRRRRRPRIGKNAAVQDQSGFAIRRKMRFSRNQIIGSLILLGAILAITFIRANFW